VKQRAPLLFVTPSVTLYQFVHRLLHDFQRIIFVAGGYPGKVKSFFLYPCQEQLQCLIIIQRLPPLRVNDTLLAFAT
jgi:hypothetical protein